MILFTGLYGQAIEKLDGRKPMSFPRPWAQDLPKRSYIFEIQTAQIAPKFTENGIIFNYVA